MALTSTSSSGSKVEGSLLKADANSAMTTVSTVAPIVSTSAFFAEAV